MNVIARLEYELAYYDSAVHRFNHYTTRTPPLFLLGFFWTQVLFLFIIPSGVLTYYRHLLSCRVNLSWMDVNFLNHYQWIRPICNFLECCSEWIQRLTRLRAFFKFFYFFFHVIYLFRISFMSFLFPYSTLKLVYFYGNRLLICSYALSNNSLVEFSLVILEGSALFLLFDSVLLPFESPFINIFGFISSSCVVRLFCSCLLGIFSFHWGFMCIIFFSCLTCCSSFFICPFPLSGFIFLFIFPWFILSLICFAPID